MSLSRAAHGGRSGNFIGGRSNSGRFERHCAGEAYAQPQRLKELTMKYLLLIYANEASMQNASKADSDQMQAAYNAYTEAMTKAGVIVGGERLRPTSSASTVRVANGKTQVLDGPYVESKEQLGGYYMIDVPDLDAAISWAARCPGASHGAMEVRPIWAM
jgi:hypothetical protein